MPSPLSTAHLDHVELQVADLATTVDRLTTAYGFEVLAPAAHRHRGGGHLTALLGQHGIRLLVVQALDATHPARTFVERHGDGVAAIALRVPDVAEAHRVLVARGAASVHAAEDVDGRLTAAVMGFGDVVHKLVEDTWPDTSDAPDTPAAADTSSVGLLRVDHFAVCLPSGTLDETVRRYQEVFGLDVIFEEKIEVGPLGMNSKVVQNRSKSLTLTLIEPASAAERGQIESFLDDHGGAGVQHVAFATDDIARSVRTMSDRGTGFLTAPGAYYELLGARLTPSRHTVAQLRDLNILVDEDHYGQLYQIFTRSEHPRGTLFFEVIERAQARAFGSNNVRALYEAVELQRATTAVAR
ncbi:4-hydroxyphenylpyruvate dioxygenase [Streptomyces sp. NPDC094447]|uniref:4-hydroxyphenylpyruvate dioxygenase n=1 Tax=Streptomyces sp. NPDC094447 TaxID=3366062 RepID=UPI003824CF1C